MPVTFFRKRNRSLLSLSTRLLCDFCSMVCSNIRHGLLSFPWQLEFPFAHPSWKDYPFNHWVPAKALKRRNHNLSEEVQNGKILLPAAFHVNIFITFSILVYPCVSKTHDTEAAIASLRWSKELWQIYRFLFKDWRYGMRLDMWLNQRAALPVYFICNVTESWNRIMECFGLEGNL